VTVDIRPPPGQLNPNILVHSPIYYDIPCMALPWPVGSLQAHPSMGLHTIVLTCSCMRHKPHYQTLGHVSAIKVCTPLRLLLPGKCRLQGGRDRLEGEGAAPDRECHTL